jgi:quercetin dioxygenase-like cupin family protein
MRNRVYVGSFVVAVSIVLSSSAAQHKDEIMIYPAPDIKWMDAPPSLPKGAKIAILEGDPGKEGAFVFRVKLPDGYRIPPHTHTKPERITVISGTFNIGMGEKFDDTKGRAMPAGTYGQWPAGMKHFVGRREKRSCNSMASVRGRFITSTRLTIQETRKDREL